ncbi:MAG: hypothetical protein P8X67_18460, partial [Syntrophobacterales bacterium]
ATTGADLVVVPKGIPFGKLRASSLPCRPAHGAGGLRVQTHHGRTVQKEEGQLEFQLTLIFRRI